jgi:hypothetical protein
MEIVGNLTTFFDAALQDLECRDDTRAYIVSIFSKYKTTNADLSQCNITLTFAQARANHNFLAYQTLGDWLFYSTSLYPEHLRYASTEYYIDIGRLSYYSCYRLINKQWRVYEEIADGFISLEKQAKTLLNQHINITET